MLTSDANLHDPTLKDFRERPRSGYRPGWATKSSWLGVNPP